MLTGTSTSIVVCTGLVFSGEPRPSRPCCPLALVWLAGPGGPGLPKPRPGSLSLDLGPVLSPRLLRLQVLDQSRLHRSCSWEGHVLRFQVDMSLGRWWRVLSPQDTPCVQLSMRDTVFLKGVCELPARASTSPQDRPKLAPVPRSLVIAHLSPHLWGPVITVF